MTLWYISFANDKSFIGATVVEAADIGEVLSEATRRGLNPGGEAMIMPVPSNVENDPDIKRLLNRLANEEEMLAHGRTKRRDMPDDVRNQLDATTVCEDCNTEPKNA